MTDWPPRRCLTSRHLLLLRCSKTFHPSPTRLRPAPMRSAECELKGPLTPSLPPRFAGLDMFCFPLTVPPTERAAALDYVFAKRQRGKRWKVGRQTGGDRAHSARFQSLGSYHRARAARRQIATLHSAMQSGERVQLYPAAHISPRSFQLRVPRARAQ